MNPDQEHLERPLWVKIGLWGLLNRAAVMFMTL
jgi:hypothetical protein